MIKTLRGCLDLLGLAWREDRVRLLTAMALMIGQAVALPLAAPLLATVTDAALAGDAGTATVAAAGLAVLVIASLTFGHFAHIAYFELGELYTLTLERELISLSNDSPGLEHHERPDSADRFHVLRQEVPRMGWSSMTALMSAISLTVAVAITAVLLGLLNPWLLLLPLAAIPPVLLGRRAESALNRTRMTMAQPRRRALHLFKLAVDPAAGMELRVCGVQGELRARHAELWGTLTRQQWRAEVRAAALRAVGLLIFGAAYGAATLLITYDAVAGRRSVGDVVLAVALTAQVNQQIVAAVSLLQQLQRAASTMENLRWARSVTGPPPAPAGPVEIPDRIRQGIRLRGVSFRYPDTEATVLDGVDLVIPAGCTVAVLGDNGAGKSTLVKLLCRFYEPTEGTIELDGVDLRQYPVTEWRRRIAAGFQDFARLEFLARETVGVGDLARIDSAPDVLAALARAQGTDLVHRLDNGLETPLGLSHPAGGTQLSGGQWQKLALGRAMMRAAPLLLVLDEPTASLDARSEHLLFEQYTRNARQVAERTGGITLLVSHRFSTTRDADLILVVAGGRVAEAGDHQQLMAAGGLYAQLYEQQAAAYR